VTYPKSLRDVVAGAGLVLLAVFFLVSGASLDTGTAAHMGPGYGPRLVAWLLLVFGGAITVRGVIAGGEETYHWPRILPLAVIGGAPILFYLLLTGLGLLVAISITAVVASCASKLRISLQSILVAGTLAVFCAIVFVKLLGQSLPLWPWH
jgi:putative tricarboxylic transport membrane protein